MNLESVLTIKGIGEKTEKLFRKLDIVTIDDLLQYYPRAYDVYEPPVPIRDLAPDAMWAVEGILTETASVKRFNRIEVTTAHVKDSTGVLNLTWFHMPFLKSTLTAGKSFVFRGRVVRKGSKLTMEQPEIFSPDSYDRVKNSMQPIYSQTKGLGNKAISRAVASALEVRRMEREYLPADIRIRNELAEYNFSIEHIHFPKDSKELLFARKRLVFDEFFLFLLAVRRLKEQRQEEKSSYVIEPTPQVGRLLKALPYELTKAQRNVLKEVYRDMSGGLVMNRLIQGDVGSGKTIIAVLALLETVSNGYQGALMAPTEVLARQHYESISEMFLTHRIEKAPILVTGSMTAREKRKAYEKIASHEADIVIGTHALIQEKVVYDNLALVITDEQHRFGVGQREALAGKGRKPHVLVMSATPIPRTLAIILYGDLDISVIDELPANRLPIKNCVVAPSFRKKAYSFIEKEVAAGRQAYVICPMVEASEMIEAENVSDYAKILKKALPDTVTVACLHGKMKPREKDRVMELFASGQIKVLVSTTVVEVGVNVPNATVMMIENAERFGLAQLHQLRGRVGRGRHQSYCIMVNTSGSEVNSRRLDILNKSNDGFFIASEDLKLRGPGDIFGVRQSGDLEFKLADIFTDAKLLKIVSEEVDSLLRKDPELSMPEQGQLKKRLDLYLEKSYEKLSL